LAAEVEQGGVESFLRAVYGSIVARQAVNVIDQSAMQLLGYFQQQLGLTDAVSAR
jgi:hypothetical protein